MSEANGDNLHCLVGHNDDWRQRYEDDIYLSLWENPGYLPDPVADAFRRAVVKTAIEICHECGTHDASTRFCADTIADWMKHDVPNAQHDAGGRSVANDD